LQLGLVLKTDPSQLASIMDKEQNLAVISMNGKPVISIKADLFKQPGDQKFKEPKPDETVYPVKPLTKDFDMQAS